MKWHSPDPVHESHPDRSRIIHRQFLWWPLRLNEETRWLETVNLESEWSKGYGSFLEPQWFMKRFADEVIEGFDVVLPPLDLNPNL
jgi:hypothetical protein